MLYLHKFLPLLISPLGVLIALLIFALLSKRYWPLYCAVTVVVVCSSPLTARSIWQTLESEYPYRPIYQVPKADAVVVLSGMLGGFDSEYGYVAQWADPDRFFAGVELVQAGRADMLIFTRGKLPWVEQIPEGELLKQKAVQMGVPSNQILLTSMVSNTAEESSAVRQLMTQHGLKNIILVTSSFHLSRAKLLFDQAGIESYPYPTDFKASNTQVTWVHYVPSADSFNKTSSGIREFMGRFYYWLMISET